MLSELFNAALEGSELVCTVLDSVCIVVHENTHCILAAAAVNDFDTIGSFLI